MIEAFRSAALGLAAGSEQLAVISTNMANVSTVGYKAKEADFADTLYRASVQEGGGQVLVGSGVKMTEITSQTAPGALQQTGRMLDFAIEGDGYFCVQGEDGRYYTRAGNFTLSQDGMLTAADGKYVLSAEGEQLSLMDENEEDGEAALEGFAQKIGVFTFPSPFGLTPAGDNQLVEGPGSGPAALAEGAAVRQGVLEGSGVDLASEMAKMIRAQRAFQANARMVTSADEIEETANALRA
ncbi:MAG TPA: flagellar hook-basal body protein [Candidatus Acidoferrum sp.]|nr:flagellar hook-basal body protein [Candidatus Acidoferrum sp.]